MRFQQRVFVLVLIGCAALAACSGSFGSGSGLPTTLSSLGPQSAATASVAPDSSSAIVTVGESTAFQPLPEVGGYGGAIAFPRVTPEPAKSPTGKGASSPAPAPTAVSIAIGATLSVKKPSDGPDLNLESGKGKHRKTRERPARPLAYITLLPTHDVTLDSYPRIAIDVPRDIVTQYRDGEFGLALWNSGEKDASYRLAVAELDRTSSPPPAPQRAAAALPTTTTAATLTPAPTPSVAPSLPSRGGIPGMSGNAPVVGTTMAPLPGAAAPSAAPTLPPQRILFAGTASTLKFIANRPAVFAVYALPHAASANATNAPAASASARAAASPLVSPPANAAPTSAPSASSASAQPSASPSSTKSP